MKDVEVRDVRTEDEANRLLSSKVENWFVLKVESTGEGILEKQHYYLVRRENDEQV